MEIMVFVTMQQMVGYVNVPQALLVITALLVRKSPKKKLKKIFQKYFSTKYKKCEEID